MNEPNRCPQCGNPLPLDAPPGICPRCILALGFRRQPSLATAAAAPGTEARAPLPATSPATPSGRFVPPKPHELAPLFPQLEIFDLIGQGGMGAVYKARQARLDRLVALKILPPDVGQDPAFAERFTREARTLGRLAHPGIVGIFDFGQSGNLYYLIMEYVDGSNLRQVIEAGKLQPAEALAIVPQVCEALQYAHDEGIVHRDIKPENILLDKKGRAKIADFGLAKLLERPAGSFTLTDTQQVMGTPHYMAPEQLTSTRAVDHRADIYSLGVVFYEMLTGELPLGRFEPPSKKSGVDARLDEVVLRTLERAPDRRYQQASAVKMDVELISQHGPHHRTLLDFPPSPPRPAAALSDDEEIKLAEARFLIKGPAIGFIVLGALTWIQALVYLIYGLYFTPRPSQFFWDWDLIALPFMAMISPLYGAVMIAAGCQMFRLRTYTLGVLAGMMAYVVPLGILPLLAWPIAIWAHVVLWKQSVADAFAIHLKQRIAASRDSSISASTKPPFPWSELAIAIGLLVPTIALIGFALVWTQSAWTLAALVAPWFILGLGGGVAHRTPKEVLANAVAVLLFLSSLALIAAAVAVEQSGLPLLAIPACGAALLAGVGLGVASQEEDENAAAKADGNVPTDPAADGDGDEEKEEEEEEDTPENAIGTPATWMMFAGGFGCLWLLGDGADFLADLSEGKPMLKHLDLLPLLGAPLVLAGGILGRSLRWYWLVVAGAILCLPLGLGSDTFLVRGAALGIGVWTLIALARPDVRAAFRQAGGVESAPRASQLGPDGWPVQPEVPLTVPVAKPSRGTIGRAWDTWWGERDRWFTNLVQSALATVAVVCLLMYLNFRVVNEAAPGDPKLRHTTIDIGSPDSWFHHEQYPEPNVPFRWQINYFSWSTLIMFVGCLAWYVYWQIEKAKPEAKWLWLGLPNTIILFWGILSASIVLSVQFLHF